MSTKFKGTAEQRQALDLFVKLARASESFFARSLKSTAESGLTPTQFGVLETLFHLGPLKPSTLAEKHLKSRNNLSVVIDHLERDGLVERIRCPEDRRAQWVHLTKCGEEKIRGVFPVFVEAVTAEASILTPEEQVQLASLLKKLGTSGGHACVHTAERCQKALEALDEVAGA
jgi:MarR family 2-MHQ and catechol resistance regulon transcriptional repressor